MLHLVSGCCNLVRHPRHTGSSSPPRRFDKVTKATPPRRSDECGTCTVLAGHVWGVADKARGLGHFGSRAHAWELVDTVCGALASRMPVQLAQRLTDACEWLEEEEDAIARALQQPQLLESAPAFVDHLCNGIAELECKVPGLKASPNSEL